MHTPASGAWVKRPDVLNLGVEALGSFTMISFIFGAQFVGQRLAGPDMTLFAIIYTIEFALGLLGLLMLFSHCPRACFNPAIALARAVQGTMDWREALALSLAQIGGAVAGLAILHRATLHLLGSPARIPTLAEVGPLSEFVAVFGVVMLYGSLQHRPGLLRSIAIALFAGLTFWIVGVPSFANAAISVSWILDGNAAAWLPIVAAQVMGALSGALLARWMFQTQPTHEAG